MKDWVGMDGRDSAVLPAYRLEATTNTYNLNYVYSMPFAV